MEIKPTMIFKTEHGNEVVELTTRGLEESSMHNINDEIRNLWIDARIDYTFPKLPDEKIKEILAKCRVFMEFTMTLIEKCRDISEFMRSETDPYKLIVLGDALKYWGEVDKMFYHLTQRRDAEFHDDELGVIQRLDVVDDLYYNIVNFVSKLEEVYKEYGVEVPSAQRG